MKSERQHHSDSFVLRIWWEQVDEYRSFWRGWVQHAATGEAHYFQHLSDLLAFVETHTGSLAQASSLKSDEKEGIV